MGAKQCYEHPKSSQESFSKEGKLVFYSFYNGNTHVVMMILTEPGAVSLLLGGIVLDSLGVLDKWY